MSPCMAQCGPNYAPGTHWCGLPEGHRGKTHMPKDPTLRHGPSCAWAFFLVGVRDEGVPLSDDLCICDPYGDKARAADLRWHRQRRKHVLWQDKVWFQRDGEEVRIRDMPLDRLQAVMVFLVTRAPSLKRAYETGLVFSPGVQGEHALDAVDEILSETLETDPVEWLRDTPLVRRLDRRITKLRKKSLFLDFQDAL